MKRYLGIPLKETTARRGDSVWLGGDANVTIRLERLDISNDHPWWCRVEVTVGRVRIKLLGMGDSEREVRTTVREALASELKGVRDLLQRMKLAKIPARLRTVVGVACSDDR